MSLPPSLALLPEGLRDTLPPQAEAEAYLLRQLLDRLAAHGYERVGTPLIEFEASLTGGLGAGASADLFRMTDPASQRALAIRQDITGQIARVASTRLAHQPRPLRLSYAGPVLRIKGTQLRADRQFHQAGCELIGADSVAAVGEVARLAVESLLAMGLEAVTLDFVLPDLAAVMAEALGVAGSARAQVIEALDAKDAALLATLPNAEAFLPLLRATGPMEAALALLAEADLPTAAQGRLGRVAQVAQGLPKDPRLSLTLDPGETRNFAYQTWVGFSLFAQGVRGEVARGGAYLIKGQNGQVEPAVGFSLYLDGLVEAGRGVTVKPRLAAPSSLSAQTLEALQSQGWAVVSALEAVDLEQFAADQRCTHLWDGAAARPSTSSGRTE
jgi:ATP phosphoribosyltransferase regulatory subunit